MENIDDYDYQSNEPGIYEPYPISNTVDNSRSMISEDLIDELICDYVTKENHQALFDILDGLKKIFKFKYKEKLNLILWSCSFFNLPELKKIIIEREII